MKRKAKPRSFKLGIIERPGSDYGLVLHASTDNSDNGNLEKVVQVWGNPLRAVTDHVLETIKKAGYKPYDLGKDRKKPFEIDEQLGVRLSLLFMAVKPLRKHERIEQISERVRLMEDEEVYYWFSKCAFGKDARRARKAFRILEAKE